MKKVTYNVAWLLRQLSAKNDKGYEKTLVADLSGISRTTITNITNEPSKQSKRTDLETVGKLLSFFESEGMPITIADLFSVERLP